jgi:hypothetical protein
VGHGLGDDHEAVGQNVLLYIARFSGHPNIVTQAGCKGETEGYQTVKFNPGITGQKTPTGSRCYRSFSATFSLPYSLV